MGNENNSEAFNPRDLAKEYLDSPDHRVRTLAKFALFASDLVGLMLQFAEQLKVVREHHGLVPSENEPSASESSNCSESPNS